MGFDSDLQIIRRMKEAKPDLKVAFVGPHVQIKPKESLMASPDIDFIVRGEFDHAVVEFAQGKPLGEIAGVSYRKRRPGRSQPVRGRRWKPKNWTGCLSPRKCTSAIW